jgi:hypothetical protein
MALNAARRCVTKLRMKQDCGLITRSGFCSLCRLMHPATSTEGGKNDRNMQAKLVAIRTVKSSLFTAEIQVH